MKSLGVAMLMAGGCIAVAEQRAGEAPIPVHGSSPGYRCSAAPAQLLVGQSATSELGARALQLAGARTLRWIRPGQVVTMDYREDRLNIELDDNNKVRALRCG
jgi:positive regulator of sigma E activity